MTAHRSGAWLLAASLLAACGARSTVLLDDFARGAGGASAGRSRTTTAGAPNAGAPNAGAPNAGAPNAGTPNAGAPGAGAGPTACTGNGVNCPNGFACVGGTCLTQCDSIKQCRPDRFCAAGTACPPKATHIAAGVSDTCAALVDGTVRCWGDGDAGQLGDGLARTSNVPITVKPIVGAASGIRQLELGTLFACAVTGDGQGSCWGAGDLGQLGAGSLDASSAPIPINAAAGTQLSALGAGQYHACGIWKGGEVRCWGANFEGQLGTGDTMSTVSPVPIDAPADPATLLVRSGDAHSCILVGAAMSGSQSVRCWGDNSELQLGDTGFLHSTTPLSVPDVVVQNAGILDLAAGAYHTCALYTDGKVRCWGDNSQQQLGVIDPPLSAQARLVNLPAGSYAVAISAGEHHTCVLLKDRRVMCWGNDAASGTDGDGSTAPIAIRGLASTDNYPTAIAAGSTHTCALMSDGAVRCWGSNYDGALGVRLVNYSAQALPVQAW